jgi:SAM-dependent methyltransferase
VDGAREQAAFWDGRADAWARNAEAMETFSRQFGDPALDLLDARPGQHVADIGCGPGLTTIELARRVAPDGTATGVDVSPGMITAASARADPAVVGNVRFAVGDPTDAPSGPFDGIYSRFGTMFFVEPATAFTNLARSIHPGGRMVATVWAELDANPWMFLPTMFAAGSLGADLTLPGPDEPGPFSLADGGRTAALLESCGFCDVDVVRQEGTWTFGADTADDAIAQMLSVGAVGEAWAAAADPARTAAVEAGRAGCDDHRSGDRWDVPAAALLISATVPA